MRFQINDGGWFIGATLIPAATILDYADKREDQLSPWETVAKGRTPPLTATALDADAAMALWRDLEIAARRMKLYKAGLWEHVTRDWADDLLGNDYEPPPPDTVIADLFKD